jgi:pyruvate formate lyase activating enzyme
VLLRDFSFYKHTQGGVTLSGGEPTLYPDYVGLLLQLLKTEGVHVVLETCGYFHYETFRRKLLPFLDLVYFDVKLADPQAHRRHTGRTNHKILDNLRRLLAEPAVEVQPRVPLVPWVTATRDNLVAVVDILCDAGADSVQLLPYNPLGLQMIEALGRPRPPMPGRFMKPRELQDLHETFKQILADQESRQPLRRLGAGRALARHTADLSSSEDLEGSSVRAIRRTTVISGNSPE